MHISLDAIERTRGGTWTSGAASTIIDKTSRKGHRDTWTSWAASSTLDKNIKKEPRPWDPGDSKRLTRAHFQRHMNLEYGNFNP